MMIRRWFRYHYHAWGLCCENRTPKACVWNVGRSRHIAVFMLWTWLPASISRMQAPVWCVGHFRSLLCWPGDCASVKAQGTCTWYKQHRMYIVTILCIDQALKDRRGRDRDMYYSQNPMHVMTLLKIRTESLLWVISVFDMGRRCSNSLSTSNASTYHSVHHHCLRCHHIHDDCTVILIQSWS